MTTMCHWKENMSVSLSFFVVWVLILFVHSSEIHDVFDDIPCPKMCLCRKSTAKCYNGKLEYFPRFPSNITYLFFSGNDLGHISKTTFKPLSYLKLRSLHLMQNKINFTEGDCFQDLQFLRTLEISKEDSLQLATLGNAFHSITKGLKHLTLRKVNLSTLSENEMLGLSDSSIQSISFVSGKISNFYGSWFRNLSQLKSLDLSDNSISIQMLHLQNLENITYLNLATNNLQQFPDFCSANLSNLKYLDLQSNKITTFKYKLRCLDKLEELNLGNHAIRLLYSNTFSDLPMLRTLRLDNMAGQFKLIRYYAFNSSSLQELFFSNNGFHFNKYTFNPQTIFKYCPNLRNLDLSFNYFEIVGKHLKQMLSPLQDLERLTLVGDHLFYLPPVFLDTLVRLQYLNLSNNQISTWNGRDVFSKNTSLKVLDLSKNGITVFNKSSIPLPLLDQLDLLNLADNAFSCSCSDIFWFYVWMKKNMNKLIQGHSYKCWSPIALRNKLLVKLTHEDICPIREDIKIVIALSSAIIIVIIVAIVIYRMRWHIRYWLYIIRSKRIGYELITNEGEFVYDAFVVYADEDRRFVHEVLIPTIEKREGFRLCIHYRDFDVGKLIADNIVENINMSRKVILILSNHFAKSKWCEFEMTVAQNRFLTTERELLVLIALEEIQFQNMNSSLRMLLTTMTYATWSTDFIAQELCWNQVLSALKESPPRVECADKYDI